MFWYFLLTVCCLPPRIWTSRSGIYIDNGIDQTVMDLPMSDEEKKELEAELLMFLGLPVNHRRTDRGIDLKKSAPRYLMDVYEALMDEGDGSGRKKRNAGTSLSREEQDVIDVSDLIMTFENEDNHVSGVRHEKGKRLWFNISDIPPVEGIVGAELRIFQDENFAKKLKNRYTVSVFQLMESNEGESELEYISSVDTTATFTGWLRLNLTKCVAHWATFPNSNKGLYLSVHPIGKPAHEIKPENLGLITSKGEKPEQPFTVVFLKSADSFVKPRHIQEIYHKRYKRSAAPPWNSYFNRDPYSGGEMRICNIHTLYVDFNDLNWSSWIIAPEGFAANYCFGKCDFPLNARMNATNHAIVQSMMHLLVNHLEYPKPCCTPMKLHPMSVLFYGDDTNNSVTLKKYQNMIVKNCGCH